MFDLLDLRPFQNLHVIPTAAAPGVDVLAGLNVHSIAIQVPISDLTGGRRPKDVLDPAATIGVWTTASRRASRVYDTHDDTYRGHGPWRQVSRLGNPLVNEALIPMGLKDVWNGRVPRGDKQFLRYVQRPEVARLLPVLYPGVFPHLAGLTADRADLVAVLLTGLPKGVVPGFQNYTGPTIADVLRLNVAVPPASSPEPAGAGRRRRRRLPQRTPGPRRRRHRRTASHRRGDVPAGRSVVHAGRGGLADQGRDDAAVDVRHVPVPRHAARRLQPGGVMGHFAVPSRATRPRVRAR